MYPKLWEVPVSTGGGGLSYTNLISRLIGLATEKFEKERGLKISR